MSLAANHREIPYNYTSFSDREIVLRLLGEESWALIEELRNSRDTGHSARQFFEILGDVWMVQRNPYIQDDLLGESKRRAAFFTLLQDRADLIAKRAEGNKNVVKLLQQLQLTLNEFNDWFSDLKRLRSKAYKSFSKHTRKDNVQFDGLARVSHVTDATDWRVEYPFAVLTPDSEDEVLPLVREAINLGLKIIPRGGGTGYTGGVIPLQQNTVVINTEKLLLLSKVEHSDQVTNDTTVPIVEAGAGVVTRRVSDLAQAHQLVFAVDPTSQDASTIGGNVSMNAGGKKAVMWGTALDNLHSWTMVSAQGDWLTVKRLNHNLGKIHDQTEVQFAVQTLEDDRQTPKGDARILSFEGQFFRKVGLGKDVTNKFLGGLPGIQKEGCDGIITSAQFILHRMPDHIRTICMEFYGTDLHQSTPAIVEVKEYLDNHPDLLMSGLEHLDDRYIRAVKYSPRGTTPGLPKMLLLADIVSDNEQALIEACTQVSAFVTARNGESFIAETPKARAEFWADRSRTAAIAAHTNAFKINEDVVIPLHNLAEYTERIEKINVRHSLMNKLDTLSAIITFFSQPTEALLATADYDVCEQNLSMLSNKQQGINDFLLAKQRDWEWLLANLETPCNDASVSTQLDNVHNKDAYAMALELAQDDDRIVHLLLRKDLRVSYKTEVRQPLGDMLSGDRLKPILDNVEAIHKKQLSSRLFIALHMHAGDGNVHTNIPVNSNDIKMMHQAEQIVDEIMTIAKELDGVISGEHGIGLTKIQYLDEDNIQAFEQYKADTDPSSTFNPGKLMSGSGMESAYTPSLRLVEREAMVLEHMSLNELNESIKDCLRCGKCKPVCNTHIPEANLLYSPRNKILATGLVIEAILYEEQTRRGISLTQYEEMNDIAEHCTVCHKCESPCPVNIDFGDVTVTMRKILRDRDAKRGSLIGTLSMAFLNESSPFTIKAMRIGMINLGYPALKLIKTLFKPSVRHAVVSTDGVNKEVVKKQVAKRSNGQATLTEHVVHFISKPVNAPAPWHTMRAALNIETDSEIPIIRKTDPAALNGDNVFYFPGCGSERLFSQVGIATLGMLYEVGASTVLPPGYLCCGYPQNAAGQADKAKQINTDNQVLFHRVAHTLSHMPINKVVVSCGTCFDQLQQYQFDKIFPGCEILDIHEYLLEQGVSAEVDGVQYLYHDPCHSPMKKHGHEAVGQQLLGSDMQLTERCCGEAGTFAVTRPDIASQLRQKKLTSIEQAASTLDSNKEIKVLTSCPACQQGLSRYETDTGYKTDYIVVELAKNLHGDGWSERFIEQLEVEKVLL